MTFLFWNLKKKPLQENIRRLVSRYDIDVLIFAEFSIEPASLLKVLNQQNTVKFHYAPGICRKIVIFSRFPNEFIKPVYESDRLTVRHLKLPAMKDILLAAVHFPSKNYWSDPESGF